VSAMDPFAALGLPARPDLTDEEVRAAWRAVAAVTHPDRPDGGDVPRYTAAASAYAALRTPWGRSEAWADLAAGPYVPAPAAPAGPPITASAASTARALLLVPARAWHGRPLRLLARAVAAAGLSLLVLRIAPGQPAGPAVVAGLITWFTLTARADLAPPPGR
jgi:hypothetical protein